MGTLLDWREKENKDKHGKNFHDKRKYFSLIDISVDGMLGKDSLVVIANMSRLMAVKIEETILHIIG